MEHSSRTIALRRAVWLAFYRALKVIGREQVLIAALGDFRKVGPVHQSEVPAATKAPRVLFIAPRFWSTHVVMQVSLAQALVGRGAECAVATCGGTQPICEVDWREKAVVPYCGRCVASIVDLASAAGIPTFTVASHVDAGVLRDREAALSNAQLHEIEAFEWNGVAIGRGAVGAARWKLRTHFLDRHPAGRDVTVDFARSGVRWADGMDKILERFAPDVVVMLNGMFLPERVTAELAERRGVRLVFFERGRDAGSIFLSHQLPAPKYDITASWSAAESQALSPEEDLAVDALLSRRSRGENVIESYWEPGQAESSAIAAALQIPEQANVAVLFTNVIWDTAMQDRDVGFRDMFEWLERTVEIFAARPDWTLVIRVHPAETQLEGRESHDRVADWIRIRFLSLPANVRIVPPDQPVDSYALMRLARLGLVYASTAGLELALHDVPVIVAGDAHYRGKGFTHDPATADEFGRTIHRLLDAKPGQSAEFRERARKYAHLFFLRRTLPASIVAEPVYGEGRLAYTDLGELKCGQNPTLDIICDGILNGSEFSLP